MSLGKTLNCSVPLFPHQLKEDANSNPLGLLQEDSMKILEVLTAVQEMHCVFRIFPLH